MEFIKAKEEHLDRIWEMTGMAKAQLKNLGLDQWQTGYPSLEVWENDIAERMAYLAVEDGVILGAFAYQVTPDISYYEIEEGKWLTNTPYASMHRVVVSDGSKGKGVAGQMFAYGFSMARKAGFDSLRIDTHPGNLPMQRALAKAGFQKCGIIHLAQGPETGHARIGFERIL